jgi:hypothetical protein
MDRLRGPIGSLSEIVLRVDKSLGLPKCCDQCECKETCCFGEGCSLNYQVIVQRDDGTETYELDDVNTPLIGELPGGVIVETI